MPSPLNGVQPLSLHTFLTSIFPPNTPDASIHLCQFPGDPHGPWANWAGFRYKGRGWSTPMQPECNQYFCIGVLDPASESRLAVHVIGSPLIALDDVGTKVPMARVRALLADKGLRPSAVIETSAGNYSVLYKVLPPGDATAEVAAIRLASLRKRLADLGLTDPATHDPARYMRLPWGVNGKSGFRVRLRRWAPLVPAASFDMWASALWADQAMQRLDFDAMSGASRFHLGERRASLHDPLVKLAAEVGLDPHETRPGVIEADCPFFEEHSGGDRSGFAFVNWGRCHCHHGHCASRRSSDFQRQMVALYDQQISLGVLDGSYRWTSDDTVLLDGLGASVPANGMAFLSAMAFDLAGDEDVLVAIYGDPPQPSRTVG